MKKKAKSLGRVSGVITADKVVVSEIRALIEAARGRVAAHANAELTMLYWKIGERIRREILKNKRAEYGLEIVATVSQQLTVEYGRGFTRFNLARMVQLAREFYSEMCRIERWSVRTLRKKISRLLFCGTSRHS